MKFGPEPAALTAGALAAHTIRAGDLVVRKGTAITPEAAARLAAAGLEAVVVARPDPGDVGEDEAAFRIAEYLAGENVRVEPPFTGRANLFAAEPGILLIDRAGIDRLNAVDEAVTAATLPEHKPVVAGEMVGTVKIIPYAVPGSVLENALRAATADRPLLSVAPYRRGRVAVVSTLLPGLKPSAVEKTVRVLGQRLAPAGAAMVSERRVAHGVEPLQAELARAAGAAPDLIVVFGASAIADRRDVIPAALEAAGGRVEHFGMPVDPGNLLLVGSLGGTPVLGAPGCARSPKENGFDWVLQRLLAGLPVTRADIVRMGVGGLLMEIGSRGQPRAGGTSPAAEDE